MATGKFALGLAAAAMIAVPAVAQVAMTPSVAPLSGDEAELGGGTSIILALGAAAAVVGAIIVASDSDDTDLPVSN